MGKAVNVCSSGGSLKLSFGRLRALDTPIVEHFTV